MIAMDRQSGFTLFEIIAVLVILGVLTATAIPKYQDLQNAARQRALDGAIAAGMSQLTMAYSVEMLLNNGSYSDISWRNVTSSCTEISGDFSVTCSGSNPVTVRATDSSGASATGEWRSPIGN